VPRPVPFTPELIGHGETVTNIRESHDEDSESLRTDEFREFEDARVSAPWLKD
jgi:hypothetical protein